MIDGVLSVMDEIENLQSRDRRSDELTLTKIESKLFFESAVWSLRSPRGAEIWIMAVKEGETAEQIIASEAVWAVCEVSANDPDSDQLDRIDVDELREWTKEHAIIGTKTKTRRALVDAIKRAWDQGEF